VTFSYGSARCKQVAGYITTKIGIRKSEDESLEAMPNVFKAGKAYHPGKPGYGVSQAVADGRRAAEVIHKMARLFV
jgi:NADPH-dependent glutamate synthase beta subunit-like oxidoreductase